MNINRLVIKIITENEPFFFDQTFQKGLNVIASDMNTSGKSSVISAIMYGLGMEEIIGGRGSKVLSALFNNKIKDMDDTLHEVVKADIFLEISNDSKTVTILRTVNDLLRDDNLVTVLNGTYDARNESTVIKNDFFVHSQNSAKGKRGFFKFLEDFLGFNLPNVLGYDGKDKKLYLQNIFAATMIEQKRGWSDILSRVPNFGIIDSKKKTIEYILNMDSLELSKTKAKTKEQMKDLKSRWNTLFMETSLYVKNLELVLMGVTKEINYIESDQIDIFSMENSLSISELKNEYKKRLTQITDSKYKRNYENNSLNDELISVMEEVNKIRNEFEAFIIKKDKELIEITSLENGLENLENDIQNNKDISKIIKYGSEEESHIFNETCPTCNQKIEDTLLASQSNIQIMTPEENISHLKNQKVLFESVINQKKIIIKDIEIAQKNNSNKIEQLNKLAVSIKQDLYKINDEYDEHVIIEKINLERKLESLNRAIKKLENVKLEFVGISDEYKQLSIKIKKLDNEFSQNDLKKINNLKNGFVQNLKKFGYRSIDPENNISISEQTLLPEIMGYDLKFDSSASDHIRGIWAYTIALQETSLGYEGNHPNLMIFDEPNQHSIIDRDMRSFLSKVKSLNNEVQTIIGFTMKNLDAKQIIEELGETANIIKVDKYALQIEIKE